MRCNDAEQILIAAQCGHGKAVLPCQIADSQVNLVRLPQYQDVPSREIWLLAHPNVVSSKKIRVTMEWLTTCFREPS